MSAAVSLLTSPATPSDLMAQGLFRIHSALRRSLDAIIRVSAAPVAEADRAGFAEFCARFTRFLHVHHQGEEEIIFPKLTELAARAKLPVYATDVTGWKHDHETLIARLTAFETALAQFRQGGSPAALYRTATDVREVLLPHLHAEESELIEGRGLAKLLHPDEAAALEAASARHGQRVGGPTVLLMLVHALTADEQKAQFGAMPWFVRALLLKRLWSLSFRGCLKFAYNPVIAL